eukprot:scaffold3540_cov90-Alexandrium_tamarense.AAC.2
MASWRREREGCQKISSSSVVEVLSFDFTLPPPCSSGKVLPRGIVGDFGGEYEDTLSHLG